MSALATAAVELLEAIDLYFERQPEAGLEERQELVGRVARAEHGVRMALDARPARRVRRLRLRGRA